MTTKTKPADLVGVAEAVHRLPTPQTAPTFHVPPQGMLPPVLWPARQTLADARAAWQRCETERAAAVAATRTAPQDWRDALAQAVAGGQDVATLPDPRVTAADNVERLRQARRQAEVTLTRAYRDFIAAVEEHRAELLAIITPVRDTDAADVERLRSELADATRRLAASTGALTWATSCQPGDRGNRQPFTQS